MDGSKLDKLSCEAERPEAASDTSEGHQQHKDEQQESIGPVKRKQYSMDFLLSLQFCSICMVKPENLPNIQGLILDQVNKAPLHPALVEKPRGPVQRRTIIIRTSLRNDVQLSKAEKAWKSSIKMSRHSRWDGEALGKDVEARKTQEMLKGLRSILNKVTPEKFDRLMKQVKELTINTEERLKGAIELIFDKAISEQSYCVTYAKMCYHLMDLSVASDNPDVSLNFHKLLLERCEKEFQKDQEDDRTLQQKQKELDAAQQEAEREQAKAELEGLRYKARRRSLGNVKFIGELFKLKMLTEAIMHDCVVKLLKNEDEESVECYCKLLSTVGKDLDTEKAKPQMDQYYRCMDKIIREGKTSSRIRFLLLNVLDLRKNNWVPRRPDEGPKTIQEIHLEVELQEQREQFEVQQLTVKGGGGRIRGCGGDRSSQSQEDGWNLGSKKRPLKLTNTTTGKNGKNGLQRSFAKGCSGAKPDSTCSSGNDFSQQGPSARKARYRDQFDRSSGYSSHSDRDRDRFDRFHRGSKRDRGRYRSDRDGGRYGRFDRSSNRDLGSCRSDCERDRFDPCDPTVSRESQETLLRAAHRRDSTEHPRGVPMVTERDKGGIERAGQSWDVTVEPESTPTTPPPLPTPSLTEEEVEKKTKAIVEEYLHINSLREALECVAELNSTSLLYLFVRCSVESMLDRSAVMRERLGVLLCHLVQEGALPTQQFYKGLEEILEVADNLAIDIPFIWLYLGQIVAPMLLEGGLPMGQLFREISKPLLPVGKAGILLASIVKLLCKQMSPEKVGAMWTEAGLTWSHFLPQDQDVNKFATDQEVEFTLGEEVVGSQEEVKNKVIDWEELTKELGGLLQKKSNNQQITDWIQANLGDKQTASHQFVRGLMTSVCQSVVTFCGVQMVKCCKMIQKTGVLQNYLSDEQKQLEALNALQELAVRLELNDLPRTFFYILLDEDVIDRKQESSKDAADGASRSVSAFFARLRDIGSNFDEE